MKVIERGVVVDFDEFERLCETCVVAVSEHRPCTSVLMAESVENPRWAREQTAQMFFEVFEMREMALVTQAELAVRNELGGARNVPASDLEALVVHLGHEQSYACAYRARGETSSAFSQLELTCAPVKITTTGSALTRYLTRLVAEDSHGSVQLSQKEAEEVKRIGCYIKGSNINPSGALFPMTYQYPGQEIHLSDSDTVVQNGAPCHLCPRALFSPAELFDGAAESTCVGVVEAVKAVLDSCGDNDNIARNIVLSGGSARFGGLREELQLRLRQSCSRRDLVVRDNTVREATQVWRGGALMLNDSNLQGWLTREEFEEVGAAAVHDFFPPGLQAGQMTKAARS